MTLGGPGALFWMWVVAGHEVSTFRISEVGLSPAKA
jgi:Na+/alanine symporter